MFMKRIFNSKKLWSFKIVDAHCLLEFIALQKFKMEMKTLAIYSIASPYFRPTSTRLSHDAHRNINRKCTFKKNHLFWKRSFGKYGFENSLLQISEARLTF